MFQQSLAKALGDATMHLAGDDHRVDGFADVIGDAVADHLHGAGFRVDLHLRDMAAIGEGVVVDGGDLGGIQRGDVLALGGAAALVQREGDDVHAAISADHGEAAGFEDDIDHRGFQRFGRGAAAFLDHRGGSEQDGLAFGIQAAGAAGAAAGGHFRGIALADADALAINAEPVGGELDIGGFVPLAGGLGADIDIDVAIIGEADFRTLGRVTAGGFEVIGHADATQFAAAGGLGAAGVDAGPVRVGQGGLHHQREVAAVIDPAHRRGVRHGVRLHHVAAAQFDTVDAQFARSGVDQAFDEVVGFRPAGAAIGIDRDGVGEHAEHVGVDGFEPVDAGEHPGAGHGGDIGREVRQIGAHAGEGAGAQGEELAVFIHRDFAGGDVVAALAVGEEGFLAFRDPAHRLAELAGGVGGQHMFGVEEELHAEAAADIGGDDAHGGGIDAEDHAGHDVADGPAALGVGADGPGAGRGIVIGQTGTGFHRIDHDAVVDHGQAGDMGGGGEQRLGFRFRADFPVEAQIAGCLRPHLHRIRRNRRGEVGDGGQQVVLHHDGFQRIAPGLHGFGHHEGDGFADMAHLALGQGVARRADLLAAVAIFQFHQHRQQADLVGLQIGVGVDRAHAGKRGGGGGINAENARRGVRAAQHQAMQHARQAIVCGVAAMAFQ